MKIYAYFVFDKRKRLCASLTNQQKI